MRYQPRHDRVPDARAAILVAAIFDAFLSIYNARIADHVLMMCVRALAYCPPVDLTFGEYLRALVTADRDVVPNDDRTYRIAFVEAFRQRGIYPRDVRALSVDNLCWRGERDDDLHPSQTLSEMIGGLQDYAHRQLYARTRRELFDEEREARVLVHDALDRHFSSHKNGKRDAAFFGLEPNHSFEVHAVHLVSAI